MTSEISIKNELLLMIQYNLSIEEMFILKLIFLAQESKSEFLELYINECNPKNELIDILKTLQDKNVLIKNQLIKGDKFNADTLKFNKFFEKNYLKHSYEIGMDLFNKYPSIIFIDGKRCSLKNISKKYNSIEEMSYAYGKAIGFDYNKHKEVLAILQWAIENDLIHYGICEFIISMKWLELSQLKEEGLSQFDTITLM